MTKKITKAEHNMNTFPPIVTSAISECNALYTLFFQQMGNLLKKYDEDYHKLQDNTESFVKEKGKVQVPLRKYRQYKIISETVVQDEKMIMMSPKFAISHLVQIYDIFLTHFLEKILLVYPGVYGVCDKPLKMEQHKDANSIDDVKLTYIKIQIEELMRDSHINQIKWIDKKLKTKLEDFPLIKNFIFLTEVRNIIIHNDGIINGIFKTNLKKNGIDCTMYKLNTRLNVSSKMMYDFFACIIGFIVFIYASLCRKIFKKENALCQTISNDIIYEYLCAHNYKRVFHLAKILLEAKINLPKSLEDVIKINLAIACKKNGDSNYKSIIEDIESDECDIKFAKAVLLDEYEEAVKLFMDLGPSPELYRGSFEWPLLDGFRETMEFKQAFKDVFGEEFDEINECEEINKEKSFLDDTKDDIDDIEEQEGCKKLEN